MIELGDMAVAVIACGGSEGGSGSDCSVNAQPPLLLLHSVCIKYGFPFIPK